MMVNRLANEKSPYLRQHANNPVDWYPWGDEAFAKAKAENKPIFLSGYSTCHWCHVMERESFENAETAKLLNDYFVSIKVDREERPDVDRVYMSFIQATSGGGGWPMSVFLTPDLKPITGGTYFPPKDMYGRPGFPSILKLVADKWREDGPDMVATAEAFLMALKQSMKRKHNEVPPVETVFKSCYNRLCDSFDELNKGFAPAPKFPKCVDLDFLLCFYAAYPAEADGKNALRMVGETLEAMSRGGIHDHVGKGFHRYSVDAQWHVPHFEKMLYDQAQLISTYSSYFLIMGKFKEIIEDIADYVESNLTHQTGGFYSAEDADSLPEVEAAKKREGAYYSWTEADIDEALKDLEVEGITKMNISDVFKQYYNVRSNGNVPSSADPHGELKGQNILIVRNSLDECAAKLCISSNKLSTILEEARKTLLADRQKRPRPDLDNKFVTAWNGLMISGLAKAAVALQSSDLLHRAQQAVEFVNMYLLSSNGLLRSAYVSSTGGITQTENSIRAYADDYAFLIQGLLDLYDACFDEKLVKMATELQSEMNERFWDSQHDNGYHQTDDPTIIVQIVDDQDGAEPAINSVAASNLLRLDDILNIGIYKERAQIIFKSAAERLSDYPFALPKMATALYRQCRPSKQIVVVGPRNNEVTEQMLAEVSKHFDPNKILIYINPERDCWLQSQNEHLLTLASMTSVPTAYICENFACGLPITTVEDLKKALKPKN